MSLSLRILRYFPCRRFFQRRNNSFLRNFGVSASLQHKANIKDGPGLEHFLANSVIHKDLEPPPEAEVIIPYLDQISGDGQKVFFDVYGCQMNVNDTEVVWSILKNKGYEKTEDIRFADIILVVTCAIREGAETKVWNQLRNYRGIKNARAKLKDRLPLKIGVLGCMAERLKEKLVEKEKSVDIVAGPDSYRDLPRLLAISRDNQTAVNVMLSHDETYADVMPIRLNESSRSAFVSIMRGCDNMCSYCIVPFTRGRERSRPIASIVEEIKVLSEQGIKEVTLLGQNVNSYRDLSEQQHFFSAETNMAKGFKTVYKIKKGGLRFADLLDKVSLVDPEMRIRFTSPHPKDFPDEVLHLINERDNICKNIHLPAQSGNSEVLQRMRRGYTREAYLELVDHAREIIPNLSLSSDFICGFCGETDAEFDETITLMEGVMYNWMYIFPYSLREKTHAHRRMEDNVPLEVKKSRFERMSVTMRQTTERLNKSQIGRKQLILVEGTSRKSKLDYAGRNEANLKVIFPAEPIPESVASVSCREIKAGDYVVVEVRSANSQSLQGKALYHSSVREYGSSAVGPDTRELRAKETQSAVVI
ncbi:mitochondrial tRNA methylthiotransferase CDK5RAP1 [Neocloeon triangulifer]|uniref:mitochondrial tRNA methylthiotransferase CDK5RAP1 n=1 Tax=Neocloeon triangulifer TaxID=2078957 RepID=UPI00286EEC1C|nr:mitochondrial tRNA methylthiotransferase CDK5RAP1 [Neocloeon triangulifer]